MPIKQHLHTYERSKLNAKTYRCVDPECSHFARRELLLGKYAECPFCKEKFILNSEELDLAKPKCQYCKKGGPGRSKELEQELTKILAEEPDALQQRIKDILNEPVGTETSE